MYIKHDAVQHDYYSHTFMKFPEQFLQFPKLAQAMTSNHPHNHSLHLIIY